MYLARDISLKKSDMQASNRHNAPQLLLSRLGLLATVLVLVVITASAYIRLSNAGLDCVGWPGCYGKTTQLLRQADTAKTGHLSGMVPKTWAGITHRLAASGVGLIVLAIAFISLRHSRRHIAISCTLLGLTLFLAVLGKWSAASRLPAVTLGNLLGGMTLLALLWWLRLKNTIKNPAPRFDPLLRIGARLGLALLLIQIALGGLVSANFAALSCTAFPGCNGIGLPDGWNLADFNPLREIALQPDGSVTIPSFAPVLHAAHLFGSAITFCFLAWLAIRTIGLNGSFRIMGWTVLALLAMETGLGIIAMQFNPPLWIAVAHNSMAALLLLGLANLNYRLTVEPKQND